MPSGTPEGASVREPVKSSASEPIQIKGPRAFKWLLIVSLIALLIVLAMLFLALFEPPLPYTVAQQQQHTNASPQFLRMLHALTQGRLDMGARLEVYTNGPSFYPAELAAIRAARRSVHLEAYILTSGEIASQFLEALTERARAGVEVRLLIDAVGSGDAPGDLMDRLEQAGGRIGRYHPVKWYTWPRINYRTHRELLIVDGRAGFIGGAGIADHWFLDSPDKPRWRDMMVKVEGDAVAGLQSSFAENWLEATGEVMADPSHFPALAAAGGSAGLVVSSAPTTGRSTPARVLFQTLLASARERIYITTPYFVPDRGLRDEIARAAKERKVQVKLVVPGKWIDHDMVRRSSRRLYGELLEAGVEIYEYKPAMTHTKSLMVDGIWAVVGSTNFDSRSFGLNDEVNLAVRDREVTEKLERSFLADVAQSERVNHEEWKNRKLRERMEEWIGGLLERQQ